MAYFEDLSEYSYSDRRSATARTRNVGWLDADHAFPTAPPDAKLLDLLWDQCAFAVHTYRGSHLCDLSGCAVTAFVKGDTGRHLGGGEIRIVSKTLEVFSAPNLIFHYVRDHHYAPPREFIDALMNGFHPTTKQHAEALRVRRSEVTRNPTISRERLFRFVKTESGVVREELPPREMKLKRQP